MTRKHAREFENPGDDSRVQELSHLWRSLSREQRGERLLLLRDFYTLRELGALMRCCPKEVRNCIDLFFASLVASGSNLHLGRKKRLRLVREARMAFHTLKKQLTGIRGRATKQRAVNTIVAWFEEHMAPHCWEAFFHELDTVPASRNEVWHSTRWFEWRIDGSLEKLIEDTRPSRNPESYDSLFGFYREWMALWFPRAIPVRTTANSVLDRVRRELQRRADRVRKEERIPAYADWNKYGW